MNETVLQLEALTIGSRGPRRSLSGAPSGVGWWPGVQDVGVGGGVLLACLNRAPCRLPAWLPLSALVWVGRAKMKKKKKMCRLLTGLPGQTHPGGGRGKARQGESSEAVPEICF